MIFRNKATGRHSAQETLEARLARLADAGPQPITDRLAQLDREWSAGRMTKATIGVLTVVGLGLALLNPWWLLLPAVSGLSLLEYLFSRTSWMGAAFRELGFRSGADIDQEKFALRALRGDFKHLPTVHEIESKDDIARLEGEGGIALDPEAAKPDAKEVVREVLQAAKV
jgi:hypothetical protein